MRSATMAAKIAWLETMRESNAAILRSPHLSVGHRQQLLTEGRMMISIIRALGGRPKRLTKPQLIDSGAARGGEPR